MKQRAKKELAAMICGLLMIIAGVFLFLSKVRIESSFFNVNNGWAVWKDILALVPLIAGIVMMIVLPHKWYAKLVAAAGAVFLLVVIIFNTTLILKERIAFAWWMLIVILWAGGLGLNILALFSKKKEDHEKE